MVRHIVYCLLCESSQDQLPTHLLRTCMKDNTPEERHAEVERAKASQRTWAKEGRVWDFNDLSSLVKDNASCMALAKTFLERGFFVTNMPQEVLATDSARQSAATRVTPSTKRFSLLEFFKPKVEATYARLRLNDSVEKGRLNEFRRYCVSVMMLEHHKTPRAVMELTVEDWHNRTLLDGGGAVIKTTHGGAPDSLTLTNEQEAWFDCYFSRVRSVYLTTQEKPMSDKGRKCKLTVNNELF
ncbi:uncharacterized protein LOC123484959 [Coregonus clupeaformis]|uniref:uncharacterized protein LOC123484959 n=1 Tax=Coregonus clupeaformis TaxID=59861 RepID=UPI001E1C7B68|nr:uncharacterized protein LOC123484959 [Coregonus clupeaformis]